MESRITMFCCLVIFLSVRNELYCVFKSHPFNILLDLNFDWICDTVSELFNNSRIINKTVYTYTHSHRCSKLIKNAFIIDTPHVHHHYHHHIENIIVVVIISIFSIWQGTMECILAAAISGIMFALFSGQPLNILGSTGPMLVLEGILYRFCM